MRQISLAQFTFLVYIERVRLASRLMTTVYMHNKTLLSCFFNVLTCVQTKKNHVIIPA